MPLLPVPELHRNPFLAALQPLFWLFFQPSAWQAYCQYHTPTLSPLFSLAVLSRVEWSNPALRRLLWLSYGLWPCMIAAVTIGFLTLTGTPLMQAVVIVAFGFSIGSIIGLVLSAAAGMAALTIATIASAIIWHSPEVLLIDMVHGTGYTWVYGVTGAIAAHIIQNLSQVADAVPRRSRSVMFRQFGGFFAALTITIMLTLLIIIGTARLAQARGDGGVADGAVSILFVGIPALLLGLTAAWRTGQRRAGIRVSLLIFWVATWAFGEAGMQLGVDIPARQFLSIFTLMTGLTYLVLFILSFVLVEQLTGTWAAAVAGVIAGIALVPILNNIFQIYAFQENLRLAIVLAAAGVTMQWWRPILSYPFQAAFHAILLQRVEKGHPLSLYKHPAQWDELQFLPLYGFDDLLVELIERQAVDPVQTLAAVSQSRQAWAAQAAQVEVEARRFARCGTIEEITAIGDEEVSIEMIGPGSTLLRSLYLVARDIHAATAQQSRFNQRLVLQTVDERLSALLRELTRSTEFYARRFLPIVGKWQTLVATEVETLTHLTEQSGEIINPYVVGVPLTRKQEIFVGRTEVSLQIERLLRDKTHPPLLLYGQRRMGKTSLLYNLRWMLPQYILPLFVDLQGPVAWAADHAGFLYNIAKAMTVSAAEQGVQFPILERSMLMNDPFSNFDDWLDLVHIQLPQHERKTILLALDEFEALAEGFQIGHLSEQAVLGTLRHIIQHRPHFKVLLAGSHQLQEFPSWSSYLINAQTVHLSYLQADEAQQLIKTPVVDFSLTYEPAAVERIIELTHGHPYLVQLLCSEVVAQKNEQPRRSRYSATAQEITHAIPAVLQSGRQFFVDIERNQLDQETAQFLVSFATQQEVIMKDDLPSDFAKDQHQREKIIAQLSQRELIQKSTDGYQFQVPLIRQWFADQAEQL